MKCSPKCFQKRKAYSFHVHFNEKMIQVHKCERTKNRSILIVTRNYALSVSKNAFKRIFTYYSTIIGFDRAEKEPCKVCPIGVDLRERVLEPLPELRLQERHRRRLGPLSLFFKGLWSSAVRHQSICYFFRVLLAFLKETSLREKATSFEEAGIRPKKNATLTFPK